MHFKSDKIFIGDEHTPSLAAEIRKQHQKLHRLSNHLGDILDHTPPLKAVGFLITLRR